MIDVPSLDSLIVGYSDGGIRIWSMKMEENMRSGIKEPKTKLKGHNKSVKHLCYSDRYKILLSAGYEFDINIWNTMKTDPLDKLIGHESSIVGLTCPTGTFNGVSCDLKGVVKVWDLRDYTCTQTLYVTNALQLTGIISVPRHRKVLVSSRKFHIYEYDKPFSPEFSSDTAITAVCFSEYRLELFVGGYQFIKVWDMKIGRPVRLFSNIFENEITAICLTKSQQRLVAGDSAGKLKVIDVVAGTCLFEMNSHLKEIAFVNYNIIDKTILSISRNCEVRISKDYKKVDESEKKLMRKIQKSHINEILCASYHPELNLFATGSLDCTITVSYTHLRAHETSLHLVCRLLLEKKKKKQTQQTKTTRNNLPHPPPITRRSIPRSI
eukprot:TRINITY_DN42370_c0_g1_i1.p1 TRINITY_DN42370_c0_g1~~TRINITY_DN42370_c0_g1_i1.p1  ORF type:complete len:381 (+),score=50.95 TRINITY_DN42370_c0_g1_i1:280-1422(+)